MLDFATFNYTTTITLSILIPFGLYQINGRRPRTVKLNGPPSKDWIFGVNKELDEAPDVDLLYQSWERTYGPAYQIPTTFGTKLLILCDPKAIAYFYSKATTIYHQPDLMRTTMSRSTGKLLMIMEGETHKRQRRALSYAFSISAIRNLSPVFFDTAYKLKEAWDSSLESLDIKSDSMLVDMGKLMNSLSLDNIGLAGFSYDFEAIKGRKTPVKLALDSFESLVPVFSMKMAQLLGPYFPNLFGRIWNPRRRIVRAAILGVHEIASDLLDKASQETEEKGDKSILSVLVRSKMSSPQLQLSADEILAQFRWYVALGMADMSPHDWFNFQSMFIVTGYEMTAFTMTWAFIELARHLEVQKKLRAELCKHFEAKGEPTYDQLVNELEYLDAFTTELVRVHPAFPDVTRVAHEDDTIPLTKPIQTASGEIVDSLFVSKGTRVFVPIQFVNKSETLWGPDAATFNPGRWLAPEKDKRQGRWEEISGYKHLLSFADGPRVCPGKNYAIAEIKAVLSVLVRNFTFEFPDGPSTVIGSQTSIVNRPNVEGEGGFKVPIIVRMFVNEE